MSNRNWLVSGSACLLGYLVIVAIYFLPGSEFTPLLWRWQDWWEQGGAWSLVALLFGYVLLQSAVGGTLTPKILFLGGFLWLLPFLILGNCAGKAFQRSRALGLWGEGTKRVATVMHKQSYGYDPVEFVLIVQDDEGLALELPNGKIVIGFEVPVSRDLYDEKRVGDSIEVVQLPGENHVSIAKDVGDLTWYVIAVVFWAAVAILSLVFIRREYKRTTVAHGTA
jgi:hypothetical protein